jgi:hypothetical protein
LIGTLRFGAIWENASGCICGRDQLIKKKFGIRFEF